MKLATVNRELDEIVSRLEAIRTNESAGMRDEMRTIECKIRDLRKEAYTASLRESVESAKTTSSTDLKQLQEKQDEIEKKLN